VALQDLPQKAWDSYRGYVTLVFETTTLDIVQVKAANMSTRDRHLWLERKPQGNVARDYGILAAGTPEIVADAPANLKLAVVDAEGSLALDRFDIHADPV
jgi:hypothetical protein